MDLSLPHIWAIEALACSNHVETSLLIDLLKKTPQTCNDIGKNAREMASLKFLENLFIQGARANPVSSPLSKTVRLDPSDHCEDVLRQILSETSLSHLKSSGPEMTKWDLEPFIEHKRSNIPKYALKQLKDAILTGSHSISASLKEQSGLAVRIHAEHQAPVKDGNCNGITPRVEGNDTDDGYPLPRDLPDENLVPINSKRRTSESPSEQLCTTHINPAKKNKHDVIFNEQYVGGQLISSGVHIQITDTFTVSVQHIEGKRFGLERKTKVGNMGLLEPLEHDTNECTSSGLVDPNEVLPCEKKVPHCDTELNNKSEEQQRQDHYIEEEGGKNKACDLEITNEDVDGFELHMKNIDELEENVHASNDNDGNNDGQTNIARKENASLSPRYTYSQDSFGTSNSRDQNLLADTSKRYSEERCSLEKETRVDVMRQNGPSGDSSNQCNSSKELVGNAHVLPHCGTEMLNEKNDVAMQNSKGENTENGREGFHGVILTHIDKFDQNVERNAPIVGEAKEDVDISSDNDGYHDEWTSIDTKKKTFLSSQCTYSQDSLATTDCREIHLCMQCNKGGILLSCTSDSCPIVIHESCLGSDASFDTRETFYCPFCAYSRAISKYMEVKKYASLARKDLETFICLGPQNESNKQSSRSFRIDGNCLKQNDSLSRSDELNQINVVEKVSNHQRRKKLEYEQVGPSELRSDYSPPFGRKPVELTERLVQSLKRDKQDGKRMRQESQPLRGRRKKPIAAEAVHNSQSETTPCQVSETSGSEKHADVRSKKGVPCPPRTNIPCERKCSRSSQSIDAEEISEEENNDSGASKYFTRVRKQERKNLYPAIPQMRRKRLPWTREEEDTLQKGIHLFCSPNDRIIPWKKILEFGAETFQRSRRTMDLKDKWRNMCKGSPKSK
ncbi:hypothetical protein C2S51_018712 [Perilla frutescens var. frutescens]|nr:hypothetical protein C2S51_018712 [Perilla frutescens var. frutescens]